MSQFKRGVDRTITSCLLISDIIIVLVFIIMNYTFNRISSTREKLCAVQLQQVIRCLQGLATCWLDSSDTNVLNLLAEETYYSKCWIKFSGKSPFWAPTPCVNQSLSLIPVSQPASWNNNKKSLPARISVKIIHWLLPGCLASNNWSWK